MRDVPIGHQQFGMAIPCRCKREEIKAKRAKLLAERSGLSKAEFSEYRFDNFDPQRIRAASGSNEIARGELALIKKMCQNYAANPDGWIVLCGDVGNGKTHLATAIAIECMEKNMSVYCASVPILLDMLKAGFHSDVDGDRSEDRAKELATCDLLVLDDLGAEKTSDWTTERLFTIMNERWTNQLPMVVTTNLNLYEPSDLSPRILSRLTDGMYASDGGWSRVVWMPGKDFREHNPRRRA